MPFSSYVSSHTEHLRNAVGNTRIHDAMRESTGRRHLDRRGMLIASRAAGIPANFATT
jgi:hypothetical protein